MNLSNYFTGVTYLVAICYCVLSAIDNVSLLTLYWTRLIVFILLGVYAILNIASFVIAKKSSGEAPIGKKAKCTMYFELVTGGIFLIVFACELLLN